jgi:hypothetical protein
MNERKMLLIELDPPYDISWAEKEDLKFHCLRWREENPALIDWLLENAPDDEISIHIGGNHLAPDVVELDIENMIEVHRRSPTQHSIAESKDEEVCLQLSRSEAVRIACEGKDAPDAERIRSTSLVCADFMKSRFEGERFVYLTCGKRTLPIKVTFPTL